MDKLLGKYSKINWTRVRNLSSSITIKGIQSLIISLPTKKTPGPHGFVGKFYQTFKKQIISVLNKIPENRKWVNTPWLISWDEHNPDSHGWKQ